MLWCSSGLNLTLWICHWLYRLINCTKFASVLPAPWCAVSWPKGSYNPLLVSWVGPPRLYMVAASICGGCWTAYAHCVTPRIAPGLHVTCVRTCLGGCTSWTSSMATQKWWNPALLRPWLLMPVQKLQVRTMMAIPSIRPGNSAGHLQHRFTSTIRRFLPWNLPQQFGRQCGPISVSMSIVITGPQSIP